MGIPLKKLTRGERTTLQVTRENRKRLLRMLEEYSLEQRRTVQTLFARFKKEREVSDLVDCVVSGYSTEESVRGMFWRANAQERAILMIKIALFRIKEGEYTVCGRCDGEISLKRLKAEPSTRQCIMCATSEENRGAAPVISTDNFKLLGSPAPVPVR